MILTCQRVSNRNQSFMRLLAASLAFAEARFPRNKLPKNDQCGLLLSSPLLVPPRPRFPILSTISGMSARWTAQGTPPSSQGRLGPGAPSTANPDVQNIVRLVKSDPDFRNELKNVIAEALQPDLERLRAELLAQMSSNNAAAASSNMPPPLDHEALIQREFPGSSVEEWSHHDEQGSVYGFAETVSSHIIRHNNMAFLCSIKDAIDISDVVFLVRIGKLYKSVNPSSALACVLICRYIPPRAKVLADKYKMKTILAP